MNPIHIALFQHSTGLSPHATMVCDTADGRFKYPEILFSIIINIITSICFKYYN